MRRVKALVAFTVVLGGLLISSCEKHNLNVPQSNDPVFTAKGTVDANEFELVAGDDNAFMFTMMVDENNIPVFSGKLSNGDIAIELGIYDGLIDIPDHIAVASLPTELSFSRTSSTPFAFLTKDDLPNQDIIQSVIWTVPGIGTQIDTMTIMNPGKYDVCAEILFLGGDTATLCSELILGYARHANFTIKHFLNQNGTLTAWVVDPQVAIEKIEWYLDGTYISSDAEFAFSQFPAGNHVLRADVNFENGVKRSKNMSVDGSLTGKFVDDLSFFETGTLALLNRDFNIRLKFEEGGTTYSSDIANNSANKVSFSDIVYYAKDANGNDVYKVKAHIEATVADILDPSITKELEFDTTFGIAIPKE